MGGRDVFESSAGGLASFMQNKGLTDLGFRVILTLGVTRDKASLLFENV